MRQATTSYQEATSRMMVIRIGQRTTLILSMVHFTNLLSHTSTDAGFQTLQSSPLGRLQGNIVPSAATTQADISNALSHGLPPLSV